jgi:tRNA pseudouridine55 synthase
MPIDAPDDVGARLDAGYVLVDKPSGPTSYDVVRWVGDLLGVERTAHVGTLDPNVHGLLPVLLGRGVKLSGLLARSSKRYVGVLDLHGDVAGIEAVIDDFEGEIYQRPPKRSGVARNLRTRTIHRFDALEVDGDAGRVLFRVDCEAGTYIRKLCHDVGLVHGTGGHMQELRRVASGPFAVEDAWLLQDVADAVAWLDEEDAPLDLDDVVRPLSEAVPHLPTVTAAPSAAANVAHGSPLFAPGVLDVAAGAAPGAIRERAPVEEGVTAAVVTPDGRLVAVGTVVGERGGEEGAVVEPDHVLVDPEGLDVTDAA